MSNREALAANPLYSFEGLPPFDAIAAEHVEPAVRARLAEFASALERWENTVEPTWQSVIEHSLDLNEPLERAWGVTRHLLSVRNSPELRDVNAKLEPEVVEFGLRLAQSRPLYDATVRLRERADELGLDAVQRRILDLRILRARLDGIGLDERSREQFNAHVQKLSALQTEYSNNVLDATRAWGLDLCGEPAVAGLPPSVRAMLAQNWARAQEGEAVANAESGPWRVTLDFPVLKAFLEYSERRDLREQVYRANVARCVGDAHDNTGKVVEILKLRREMAHLLGFDNYAEVSLASKMANLADVRRLLEELRSASRPIGQKEYAELCEFAAANGAPELQPWDLSHWRRRLRETRFDLDADALRAYFPLDRVLSGLFALIERLFGARIEPGDGTEPVWNPDVRYYRVLDADSGEPIAGFYLDAYSRPADKRGGAWMSECIGRRTTGGKKRLPVAYLVCNGAPPVAGRPSLLSFDEVETLFHEFGHGLQHMLTHIDHAEVAGIGGVEWDAVELPSQFMENWVYHAPVMRSISAHVDTGEPLPEGTLEKLKAAANFEAATMMLRQLMFGLSDIALHADFDPASPVAPRTFIQPVIDSTAVAPQVPGENFLATFSHVFAGGYAAGYYSYKWAEVLSADAFAAFEEVGLDDDDAVVITGRRFRDTVLGLGGSIHPSDVYQQFRGKEPSIDALLRHNGLVPAAE